MSWIDAVGETLDWRRLDETFPYRGEMAACLQDAIHHAEGDVLTHTKMVDAALPSFMVPDRIMSLTTLYHDVAKPKTREEVWSDDENRLKISHPKHAAIGAAMAWFDLWKAGIDIETRLAVHGLIMWHQRSFHMWSYPDQDRMAMKFAALGDWNRLIKFSMADNAGRICANPKTAQDALVLLEEYIAETVVTQDAASRVAYLENEDRYIGYEAREPVGSRVTIMCGLPGVGKDTRIEQAHAGQTVISRDSLRLELGKKFNEGTALQLAFEKARQCLRRREPFVWNATCVVRLQRNKIVKLCREYDAHVTIEALDRPKDVVLRQNRSRESAVPENVILGYAERFDPPTLAEAVHEVKWV